MPPDADLAVAIAKIDAMTSDLSDLKKSMRDMASAVSKMAVVEERQSVTNEALGRAFRSLDDVNDRLQALEQAQPVQKQSSDMVQTAIKYAIVLLLGALLAGVVRAPGSPLSTPTSVTERQ